MSKIVTTEDPVLREIALEVSVDEISSPEIQQILKDMIDELAKEKHGVALAAPQIGVSLRIFIVAGFVFARRNNEEYDEKKHPAQIFINPEIISSSKKMQKGDEGCLSIPGKYSWSVERAEKVKIKYLDEDGKAQTRGASGFLARIFQHEIDHLNGKLYIDIANEVHNVDEDFNKID